MTDDQVLRRVRPLGGAPSDFIIRAGCIHAVVPAGRADPGLPTLLDGQDRLALPSLVDAHVHLDKTLWSLPWRPNSAGPTRNDRIANEQRLLQDFPVPVESRAQALLAHCIAQGSLHIRSHVDIQTEWGLRHVHAMRAIQSAWRDLVHLQLVAFPQGGLLIRPGIEALMRQALEAGVDIVGGIDPAAIERDPIRHLEVVFGLAREHDRGVDIHLHDPGELGRWQIERICDFTESHQREGRVTISHAYCLGQFNPADLAPLIRRMADLGVSIMSCAPAHITVPPLAVLRAAGIHCASGSDGIRDAWSPMGNGDMLDRARLIALRFGWSKDEDLGAALDIVSHGGAHMMGVQGYGLGPGCRADFVLVDAENAAAAVVTPPSTRTVIAGGRLIVRDGTWQVAPPAV
jgi:cytosine deaminase